jgi:hypothetical protein
MVYKQAWNIKNYRYVWDVSIPPNGSEMSSLLSGVCHRWWSRFLLLHNNRELSTIGCTISAPDGSSPQACIQIIFYEYRLKVSSSATIIFDLHRICAPYEYSIRCVTNAPDGSSPRGYDGVLAADYRLKTDFLWLPWPLSPFSIANIFPLVKLWHQWYDVTSHKIDLTERWPTHMGSAVNFHIFRAWVGLPLLLCTPHHGPCSF